MYSTSQFQNFIDIEMPTISVYIVGQNLTDINIQQFVRE